MGINFLLDEIKSRLDVVDVVSAYVPLKRVGRNYVGLCPFHIEKTPSFTVSPDRQMFYCFGCQVGGDVIKFIQLIVGLDFLDAVEKAAEIAGVEVDLKGFSPEEKRNRDRLKELHRVLAEAYANFLRTDVGRRAREYLKDRGIQPLWWDVFKIGYAPSGFDLSQMLLKRGFTEQELVASGLFTKRDGRFLPKFFERIMIPICDNKGDVVAFGGRVLGEGEPKYLNSPESPLFDKSRSLYGLHLAKDAIVKSRTAVIVEGYTDTIMAHQFGIDNVVATLGTALTAEHARALSRYADRIILVFDSDNAGQKAADRSIDIFFAQQIEVRIVTLPEGNDPCDFILENGSDAFRGFLETAVDALDYKWQITLERLESADTVNGRKQAVVEFMTVIANAFEHGTMDTIARGFMLNHVSQLLKMPAEQIDRMAKELSRKSKGFQGSSNRPQNARQKILDGRTRAHREILEVLLNRPEFFPAVAETITEPNKEITDPVLSAVANIIWEVYRENPEATLALLLANCQSTELATVITDLAEAGQERDNFENTLNGALENIKRIKQEQARSAIRQLATDQEQYGSDAQAAMLLDYQSQFKDDPRRIGVR